MIYKTCFIEFWKKEVMLPHPVYCIEVKEVKVTNLLPLYPPGTEAC